MPVTERLPDEVVTDHACLRYLQRVLEVDIGRVSAQGETQRLKRLCEELGVTPLKLKGIIYITPLTEARELSTLQG